MFRWGARIIHKMMAAYQNIQSTRNVDALIYVDHNYLNWYRALNVTSHPCMVAIPNFTAIPTVPPSCEEKNLLDKDPQDENPQVVSIIFARRFFEYRGTRLFCTAMKKVFDQGHKVSVTFAGTGPDEEWMKKSMEAYGTVEFIQYESADSLNVHKNKDIAVVPSLGSEGTSLSLLEAMAAGCAVVATNVGGLTDIVLDGYNGLLIQPDENELHKAICRLIENPSLRHQLAHNA